MIAPGRIARPPRCSALLGSLPLLFWLGCSVHHGGIGDGGDGTGFTDGPPGCRGLGCRVASCPIGSDTTLSGVVLAPNGADPVREALVYVPQSGKVADFPAQVSCEACANPFGDVPVTQTLSRIDGSFDLLQVPATDSTPVVIQKGRFRKVITVPVRRCQRQPLSREQTRLPARRSEGSLPRMAVAVGDFDAIECVLKNIGIDRGEFTAPTQPGAVHLYDNEAMGGPGAPGQVNVGDLVGSLDRLLGYSLVFLNCAETGNSEPLLARPEVRKNLTDYVSRGGRLYVTDWSYDWIAQPEAFAPFLCFNDGTPCSVTTPHGFHTATDAGRGGPKVPSLQGEVGGQGRAVQDLGAWLGKLPTPVPDGHVPIEDLSPDWVIVRQTATDMARYPTTTWLTADVLGARRPLTVTYDYPVAPQQACGKVLFSSYHTRHHDSRQPFPGYCRYGEMNPQEHVLEYLIFEISACVGVLE